MRVPTGSKISLALSPCIHAFTSNVRWPWDGDGNAYIKYGNAVHDVSETFLSGGPVDLVEIARTREISAADTRRLTHTAGHVVDLLAGLIASGFTIWPEVAIAVDIERGTARALKQKCHRDYSDRRKTELTCTIDFVAIRGREVIVSDWKSGKRVEYEGDSSGQMLFCGLAVARLLSIDDVTVELLYASEDGVHSDAFTMDSWALDAHEQDIKAMWKRLHSGPSPAVPGDHCTQYYCPLLGHCSATRQALVEVIRPDMPLLARIDSPEAAAKARLALAHAEATLRAIKSRIDEIASHEPLLMPNGKYYGKVRTEKETVDSNNPNTLNVIQDLLGDRWMEAVEFSISKAAIERVVGTGKKSLPIFNAMRANGVMKRSAYDSFKEHVRNDTESDQEK